MEAINYRSLAEEWLDHVARQYNLTRLSARDLPIIEHFLRAGFTLVAVRDAKKFLRVDFLAKRCRQKKRVTPSPASQR